MVERRKGVRKQSWNALTGKAFFCYFFESRQKSTLPRVIKDVRNPDEKGRVRSGVSAESIRHDDEKEVGKRDHQAEAKPTEVSLR